MSASSARLEELVRTAVRAELDDLRRFVDRRIAESSMEIHATVQLVDFSETNLSARLAGIHDQIAEVLAPPVAATHNSGVELEAVVQATENAANQIMEAAEAIGNWLQAGGDPAALPAVTRQVNAIFEACTFQDLTGQRVRRAIEHLQQVSPCCRAWCTGSLSNNMPGPRRSSSRPTSTACSADSGQPYPVFADSRVFRFGTRCRSMSWPERSALQQVASDGAGGDAGWWLWWQLEPELLDQEPESGSGWV